MFEVRWVSGWDFQNIMDMENRLMGDIALSRNNLESLLRRHSVRVLVARLDGDLVGWVAYEHDESVFQIVRIGVAPSHQRKGFGGELLNRIKDDMNPIDGRKIIVDVPESFLIAQTFFRKHGFRAGKPKDDLYRMQFSGGYMEDPSNKWSPKNRISGY